MTNQLLVSLVNSVLGSGKPTARDNYAYHCPSCHHAKPKLEIQLTENREGKNKWQCWACQKSGQSVYALFKLAKAPNDKIQEAKKLIANSKSFKYTKVDESAIVLPKEYIALYNADTSKITYRHAAAYLKRRGITKEDILKYQIGYCEEGPYRNMLISPTFDAEGYLNYFTARNFDASSSLKYKNPSVSRDIIPNEYFINWNLPIVLCEGIFDAIAIKRNAIPLLGKNIQSTLMKKIITSIVDKIYIALDSDAFKQSLRFCEKLMNEGKEIYLVDVGDKDASEHGFHDFTKIIQQTKPLTYSKLLEYKLSL